MLNYAHNRQLRTLMKNLQEQATKKNQKNLNLKPLISLISSSIRCFWTCLEVSPISPVIMSLWAAAPPANFSENAEMQMLWHCVDPPTPIPKKEKEKKNSHANIWWHAGCQHLRNSKLMVSNCGDWEKKKIGLDPEVTHCLLGVGNYYSHRWKHKSSYSWRNQKISNKQIGRSTGENRNELDRWWLFTSESHALIYPMFT